MLWNLNIVEISLYLEICCLGLATLGLPGVFALTFFGDCIYGIKNTRYQLKTS